MQNTRVLVCRECLDTPQTQLKTIIIPADPIPVIQPRVESFETDETNYHVVAGPPTIDPVTGIPIPNSTILTDQNGNLMAEQPIGQPVGLDQGAVMPLQGSEHYRVTLYPLSVSSIGTPVVTVTFSSPHGLATNDQIVVQGLANKHACGAFSITVTTATAFTYQTNAAIPAASLLTASTLMVTANIGLPLGFTQIPQTGV